MAGKIFINYRRDDDPCYTQALYQRLEDEFGSTDLFMDIEGSIKPGDDFVEVLSTQVGACDVMLAIIGPRWRELLADRVSDPADFVKIELKTAFAMGAPGTPVPETSEMIFVCTNAYIVRINPVTGAAEYGERPYSFHTHAKISEHFIVLTTDVGWTMRIDRDAKIFTMRTRNDEAKLGGTCEIY